MGQSKPGIFDQLVSYYEANYRLVDARMVLTAETKIKLARKDHRRCRFCGKSPPEVTFKQEAHALPEAIGNKSIVIYYECDTCNWKFGAGIETEFGKWSKPLRTFYQIAGKDGVPALKREGPTGWRIELKQDGFVFQQHVDNPVLTIDDTKNEGRVTVPIDAHIPIAAFKTFVKMALALIPEQHIGDFGWALDWLQEKQHSRPFSPDIARLYYSFVPGPRPFEGITSFLFLRKETSTDVPYCTFVLAVGNECLQMFVPRPEKDKILQGKKVNLRLLPNPYHSLTTRFGPATPPTLFYDLSETDTVRGRAFSRIFHLQLASQPKSGS